MLKIGSHVSMSGKDMLLGSAKEAVSYHANTFMIYTGAPQNTKRKPISDLNIEAAWDYMKENGIENFIVHAPYIINLANTTSPDTFRLAVDFLQVEIERTQSLKSGTLILHPGSHVGAGEVAGIRQITDGLNEVITKDTHCVIALETMAGKGSEIGRTFEQLARIYDKVHYPEKLRVCFDTCHTHDAGYDIVNDFDGVINEFEHFLGKNQIAAFHINDSKNERGASKDRHENIGYGKIGFPALNKIVHHPAFMDVPKILETPYIPVSKDSKNTIAPYQFEIAMLKEQRFNPSLLEDVQNGAKRQ